VGDTLASALLANGVSVVGRSFKYHRPRGVIAAGAEEPNALMQLETGAHATANVPATRIALYDGLEARAVNCLPSAAFDVGEVNNVLARFFPAGFYYKTFFWPKWEFYEPIIRRAAGLGRAADQPDPDFYDNQFAHCDVLVVGGGPAGLAAAQAASATGARVILAEQDPVLGGSLRWRTGEVDGVSGRDWIARVEAVLRAVPATRVLTNTCAMGYFDHNAIVLVESVGEQFGPREGRELPRQRVWQVRAKHVVLAAGAIERPLVFPGNDRPGVMLASAVTQYHGDFGVACGRAAVFFTNNDSAYASAAAYRSAGGDVAAVVDSREALPKAAQALRAAGVRVISGQVVGTRGSSALRAVRVRRHDGLELTIEGDLLAVSGGWTPTIHLHCQSGGVPRWNEEHACLVPGDSVQHETSAGGCAGAFSLSQALGQGAVAGADAARAAGLSSKGPPSAPLAVSSVSFAIDPLWRVEARGKAFVDFQNDVTADDVALAERENFVSVEHLKRYTALGMGTDQGKTSNINALALMSQIRGQDAAQSGVTRYRFPYQPIALSAFGALNRKEIFRPLRRMPLHERHRALGAVFEEYGTWLRPAYYLRAGETSHQAEQREITAVRTSVGMLEASPLGKIEVIGRDAGAFLDRIYANRMSNLGVGKCRYGLMLNELGVVIDDGVCAKLGADHFLVGTTSGGANRIAAWLEEWLQCEWLNFNVVVAPVTQSWGVVTLTGPKAREVLSGAGVEFDLGGEAFPHLTWRSGVVAGIAARVFRVSYTGEISYEINVAPQNMEALWQACLYAGQSFNITPIGIDALMALRTERGFLHVGADTDGTTTALDAGWGRVLSRKDDFIGRRSLMRPADQASDRLNFIGIEPVDATAQLRVGLPIIAKSETKKSDGYVTSAAFSPTLGRWVALGMLENGRARVGEIVSIAGEHGTFEARIAEPGAFDPKGERVHG
jgi:sarcosine oxidase subunit alpha